MSNTKYTDKTIADDPPGGKVHDVAKNDAAADRLPTEAGADRDTRKKTATSPETVAQTDK